MQALTTTRATAMLVVILGVSVLWGHFAPESDPGVVSALRPAFVSSLAPAPQAARTRRFVPWSFTQRLTLGGDHGLHSPIGLRLGPRGNPFVLDRGDGAVKAYRRDGSRLAVYRGRGDAGYPTDFAVGDRGGVWTTDPNGRIVAFGEDGAIAALWPPQLRGVQVAAIGDRVVVMQGPAPDTLFSTFGRFGDPRHASFGRLLENQRDAWLALVGEMATDRSTDSLYYAPNYAGLLARFDATGDVEYAVQTIDAVAPPNIEVNEAGGVALPTDLSHRLIDLGVDARRVYLLVRSWSAWGVESSFVDFYAKPDGSYLYSMEPPVGANGILFHDNEAYVSAGSTVTAWILRTLAHRR